ncbi:MAG: hypothetical protein HY788_21165 [Deltaproteobacteria bacterium]|nr:hypothetical protein [Deltaproteobacteria bacterium]
MVRKALCMVALLAFLGCATQKPVLYPNAYYQKVGGSQAETDIEDCSLRAQEYVNSNQASGVAKDTAVGGGFGAAVGAVGGAVVGSAGRGAAVGAATGATAGLLRGLFRSSEPDPLYKSFMEKCLREKGYEPMGWK